MKINTALILCAGYGKRLNPITLKTPKPLQVHSQDVSHEFLHLKLCRTGLNCRKLVSKTEGGAPVFLVSP